MSDKDYFVLASKFFNDFDFAEVFQWCPGAELNHRHRDFQSSYSPSKIRYWLLIDSQKALGLAGGQRDCPTKFPSRVSATYPPPAPWSKAGCRA